MVELREKQFALVRRLAELGFELERMGSSRTARKRDQVEADLAETIRSLRRAGLTDEEIRQGVSEVRGQAGRAAQRAKRRS